MAVEGVNQGSSQDSSVNKRNNEKKLKEEYKKREEALKKTHEEQVARLQQENLNQTKEARDEHAKRLEQARSDANRTLNSRDQKYQDEIREMQDAHKSQLRKLAEETDRRSSEDRRGTSESSKRNKESGDEQKKSLIDGYEGQISDQKKEFNKTLTKNREMAEEGIASERTQLINKNQEEEKTDRDYSNERLGGVKRELSSLRREKDAQIRDLKTDLATQRENLTQSFEGDVHNLQDTYSRSTKAQKEGFDSNLKEIRGKNLKANEKQQEVYEQAFNNLKTESGDRTNNELNMLRRKLADTQHLHQEQNVSGKQAQRVEKQQTLDEMARQSEMMEKTRVASLQESNKVNSDRLKTMYQKDDQTLKMQSKFFREKINKSELLNQAQTEEQLGELNSRLTSTEMAAKTRKIKDENRFEVEKRDITQRFKSMIEIMKENQNDRIMDLNNRSLLEKTGIMTSMEKLLKENEAKNQNKLFESSQKYESKIQTLQTQGKSALIDEAQKGERTAKEIERQKDMQFKAAEGQHQNQVEQLKSRYEHQLDNMKKRLDRMQAEMVVKGDAEIKNGKS